MKKEKFSVLLRGENLAFSSAHFLIYDGNTRENIHGHNFKVTVQVSSYELENSMVIDFLILEKIVINVINELKDKLIIAQNNENFKIEKICSCSSRKQANEEEINRIRLARNNGSALYNVTIGGEGFVGCKHRKETCKKIALSLNARSNEEKDIWRKQISKALKGKMSALLTGRTLSVEHRINIGKGIKESRRNNSAQLM